MSTPAPTRFHATRGTTRASARRMMSRMKAAINNINSDIINPTSSTPTFVGARYALTPTSYLGGGGEASFPTSGATFDTIGRNPFGGSPGVVVAGIYCIAYSLLWRDNSGSSAFHIDLALNGGISRTNTYNWQDTPNTEIRTASYTGLFSMAADDWMDTRMGTAGPAWDLLAGDVSIFLVGTT